MITSESIKTVYNVKIEFSCTNNYKSKLVYRNQQFRDMMSARLLAEDGKYHELHQLIIATCKNALADEILIHHLSPIESFEISFVDEDGYKHKIEF